MAVTDQISVRDFHRTEGLGDWRVLGDGGCAFFRTPSFAQSARLVQAIAEIPEAKDHPPAVDVRAAGVTVRLVTAEGDYMGMSQRDVTVARRVSQVARDMGFNADPSGVQYLLVIPGAPNIAEVMPFWEAILGYQRRPDSPEEDLVDPQGSGPRLLVRVDG